MSVAATTQHDAIVLLGFGGPSAPEEIRPFIDRVLDGRRIPPARYERVVENYRLIGGKSPYNEQTRRQADAIAAKLRERGISVPVEVAFRHCQPFVDDVFGRLARAGARSVLGIVLAPHQGPAGRDKYLQVAQDARTRLGAQAPAIDYIDPFFDHPLFIQAHAERIVEAQARIGRADFAGIELIFTAHSVPTPGSEIYVRQITRTAQLVAAALGAEHWQIAYQSRSGSPGDPWLVPDVRDVLRALPSRGTHDAIVAPIGFLCDHVEVLYDLDIDAKSVATAAGVHVERAGALNNHPLFIQMLVELVCSV